MIHKGETLKSLLRKFKVKNIDIAPALGVNSNYLSTLFKDPDLNDDIINKACEFIGVDRDKYFSEEALSPPSELYRKKYEELLDKHLVQKEEWLDEKKKLLDEMADYISEIASLRREVTHLNAQVDEYKSGKRVG